MLTTTEANDFARQWIAAWNAHDLPLIMNHYSDDIVFSSPFVSKIANESSGTLRGRAAVLQYFGEALQRFPSLRFQLRAVLIGIETLTILYESVNGLLAAETALLNGAGRITRVWAQYDRVE